MGGASELMGGNTGDRTPSSPFNSTKKSNRADLFKGSLLLNKVSTLGTIQHLQEASLAGHLYQDTPSQVASKQDTPGHKKDT